MTKDASEDFTPDQPSQRTALQPNFAVRRHAGPAPTNKGRCKVQEDSVFAMSRVWDTYASPLSFGLFVVADGMSVYIDGREGSCRAVQSIIDFLLPMIVGRDPMQPEAYTVLLDEAVQLAHKAIRNDIIDLRSIRRHHVYSYATVTAAMVVGSTAYVANVGDARTYLYRASEGLRRITNDHTVMVHLIEAGICKPDDIYTHPKRHFIDRALGDENSPSVEVDIFTVQLQHGDKLLLCSDGFWRMVRDPRIEDIIAHVPSDLSVAADALIQAALNGGVGKDDASVIVVSMVEVEEQALVSGGQVFV